MSLSEANTATVTMAALVDQGIPAVASVPTSSEDYVPSLSLPLPVWSSPNWSETKAGSTKSNAPTEHMQGKRFARPQLQ